MITRQQVIERLELYQDKTKYNYRLVYSSHGMRTVILYSARNSIFTLEGNYRDIVKLYQKRDYDDMYYTYIAEFMIPKFSKERLASIILSIIKERLTLEPSDELS